MNSLQIVMITNAKSADAETTVVADTIVMADTIKADTTMEMMKILIWIWKLIRL